MYFRKNHRIVQVVERTTVGTALDTPPFTAADWDCRWGKRLYLSLLSAGPISASESLSLLSLVSFKSLASVSSSVDAFLPQQFENKSSLGLFFWHMVFIWNFFSGLFFWFCCWWEWTCLRDHGSAGGKNPSFSMNTPNCFWTRWMMIR